MTGLVHNQCNQGCSEIIYTQQTLEKYRHFINFQLIHNAAVARDLQSDIKRMAILDNDSPPSNLLLSTNHRIKWSPGFIRSTYILRCGITTSEIMRLTCFPILNQQTDIPRYNVDCKKDCLIVVRNYFCKQKQPWVTIASTCRPKPPHPPPPTILVGWHSDPHCHPHWLYFSWVDVD